MATGVQGLKVKYYRDTGRIPKLPEVKEERRPSCDCQSLNELGLQILGYKRLAEAISDQFTIRCHTLKSVAKSPPGCLHRRKPE